MDNLPPQAIKTMTALKEETVPSISLAELLQKDGGITIAHTSTSMEDQKGLFHSMEEPGSLQRV